MSNEIDYPLVTIMIPTYNQEEFILEAANSALMQKYPKLEVVVGDDASTDATYETISKIEDRRLRLIRNRQNLGRTANYRNLLYNHANGDYVVNLDGDDYFTDPGFISDAVKLLGENKDVVLIVARASRHSSDKTLLSEIPRDFELNGFEILRQLPDDKFLFMHMACLYKRETALKLDFYRSDTISSDWESLFRLSLYGKVRFLDKNIGIWRIHGDNETATIDAVKFEENLKIWPAIYQEAKKQGMGKIKAEFCCARCIARFASCDIANLSLQGNKKIAAFVSELFHHYTLATAFLLVHPFYCARVILGFLGYYRRRHTSQPRDNQVGQG